MFSSKQKLDVTPVITSFEKAQRKPTDMKAFVALIESTDGKAPPEDKLLAICGDKKAIGEAYCYLARDYMYELINLGPDASLKDRYRCAALAYKYIASSVNYDASLAYYAYWKLYTIGQFFPGLEMFNNEKLAEQYLQMGIEAGSPFCHSVYGRRQLEAKNLDVAEHHLIIAAENGLLAGMQAFAQGCRAAGREDAALACMEAYEKAREARGIDPFEEIARKSHRKKLFSDRKAVEKPSMAEEVGVLLDFFKDTKYVYHRQLWEIFMYRKQPAEVETYLLNLAEKNLAERRPDRSVYLALTYFYMYVDHLKSKAHEKFFRPSKAFRCALYTIYMDKYIDKNLVVFDYDSVPKDKNPFTILVPLVFRKTSEEDLINLFTQKYNALAQNCVGNCFVTADSFASSELRELIKQRLYNLILPVIKKDDSIVIFADPFRKEFHEYAKRTRLLAYLEADDSKSASKSKLGTESVAPADDDKEILLDVGKSSDSSKFKLGGKRG